MDSKTQKAWDDWRAAQASKRRIWEGVQKMRAEKEKQKAHG